MGGKDVEKEQEELGLLRVSLKNSRYFEDSSNGKIVYLTGTHTWNNMQDFGSPISEFNYESYLDFLTDNGMNFIRFWIFENPKWAPWSSKEDFEYSPMPYRRSGSGVANDELPKFDLDSWNEEFFRRMARKVEMAAERGLYISIMIFCGCSIGNKEWPANDEEGKSVKNPWDSHPYNKANNINGIDGDQDGDGQGWDIRDVNNVDILERQKALVRKVVDTLSQYNNVLFEIANEDPFDTRDWQYEIINYIKEYESTKLKQHPIGMTASWEQPNEALYEGPADWISPYYDEDEAINPFTYFGNKVWIADTDHVFPNMGATMDFTWKAFLRGANIISMDNRKYGEAWEYFVKKAGGNVEKFEQTRKKTLQESNFQSTLSEFSQKSTKEYADRMDLTVMEPSISLSSTEYCLAHRGSEYIIYQPESGSFKIDLSDVETELRVEWFNPVTGEVVIDGVIKGGSRDQVFTPLFDPSVLYLKVKK